MNSSCLEKIGFVPLINAILYPTWLIPSNTRLANIPTAATAPISKLSLTTKYPVTKTNNTWKKTFKPKLSI